jgi:hypothetical protein
LQKTQRMGHRACIDSLIHHLPTLLGTKKPPHNGIARFCESA